MGKLVNRARMTVASAPGTGSITLGSAAPGCVAFGTAGVADGDVVSYVAEGGYSNGVPSVWEVGQGTYGASGLTLARTLIQLSSAGGTTAATLPADAQVFIAALASDFGGGVDYQAFVASGTWTKPADLSPDALVVGLLWGGGGGGASQAGGGGGACVLFAKPASNLGATETVTIGAGGAAGAAGGNSSFAGATAYGGGAATASAGGNGGGWNGVGGLFAGVGASQESYIQAGTGSFGGGGGGAGTSSTYYSGGKSTFGGGGGASAAAAAAALSTFGGNGGSSAVAAQAPGGGGYAGAAGARGELRVWTIG